MMIGAILGGASDAEIQSVEKIAHYVGVAFQIQDDILDVTSTEEVLGKPIHSDEKNQKTTYVTLLGIEQAQKKVEELSNEAIALLHQVYRGECVSGTVTDTADSQRQIRGYLVMLERIQKANDIKDLKPEELPELAQEIRKFLVEKISKTGGHLASNLGVVELTMAMHLVFDLPKDKIIWDVGHQSYTHKILTGRKDGFDDLRKYGGMSGFPKRKESDCDAFHSGHSSMSLSAALGMVTARDINHTDETIVAVIGDGALSGGMAYEALNNMARLRKGEEESDHYPER